GRGGLADPFGAVEGGLARTALSVEVKESEKEFRISAELPGVEEKDVDLSLDDGVLTISAEKKQEREEEKENYYFSKRQYGSFRRSFRLPDTVDSGKISAAFDKGVLTVHLPKTNEVESSGKKIAIGKAGGDKK
ncbi:MAG: Hsp20/alpha crystallin family protein, partial [Proteobacteria bacterium]|nr:Hsp20/alpha crystallin family protein [Pseudomonadota bacterium]